MTTLENSYLSTESKYFSTINDFVNDMLVLHTRLMQLICASGKTPALCKPLAAPLING